jgi:hypothetical protein
LAFPVLVSSSICSQSICENKNNDMLQASIILCVLSKPTSNQPISNRAYLNRVSIWIIRTNPSIAFEINPHN